MANVRSQLLYELTAEVKSVGNNKVTVVGAGQVGMACAFSILTQGISNELCLIDADEEKARGNMLDLQHGAQFLMNPKITSGSDYTLTIGSRLCIVTAGARQKENETRLSLLNRNVEILKAIIPKLVQYSPDTILLMATNPVDIMTYVAWKLSGLPQHRVIGSGTSLDSSRFCFLLSEHLGVAPSSCHGWIIGEHGDSSVAVWSSVNVAGVRLRDLNPNVGKEAGSFENEVKDYCNTNALTDAADDGFNWNELHYKVIGAAYEVIKKKGYTNWAIGLCVAALSSIILQNRNEVIAVSTAVKGRHGIDKEIFLSLPCVLNASGVSSIVELKLTPDELEKLQNSAKIIYDIQSSMKL